MSDKTFETGGPAFPMPVAAIPVTKDGEGGYARLDELTPGSCPELLGMTLRDYFAAAALTGFAGNPINRSTPEEFAKVAYQFADALIAERQKGRE